ncbi:hypothetical protein [Streptomyces collinus]|uniref:4-amino-4-deoxy-L-arabinose transferase-like glycosyltransferase n=2 Tax=Streptomyces collinus TaxID=42684 RepID=A0AA89TUC4_STRCU|nr:hypothetical protein [Streptomyces collinus]MBB5812590.1 4-amino-4-deoxy-L-arabinose transferase-like glycosyltransferase [Streptomyces collinus]WMX65731.1 hypothetical protein RFN52_21235 [Streptomyces collinus]
MTGNTGWGMLVNHTVGPQIAWFLPLAVLAVVTALVWRAREPRTDLLRAGFLLWGGWLTVHAVVFSVSNGNHVYYTAVLAPAIAALAGGGLALFWSAYEAGGRRRLWLPSAIALTVAWALVLDRPTWFASRLLVFAVIFAVCAAFGLWPSASRASRRLVQGSVAAGIAATLLVPAGWAVSSLDPHFAGASTSPTAGPVGEFHHRALHDPPALRRAELDRPSARDTALLDYLVAHRKGEKYLLATQAAYPAERLLRAQAQPVLVMGGFTGKTPFPSAPQLANLIATHQLRYVLLTHLRPTTPATSAHGLGLLRLPGCPLDLPRRGHPPPREGPRTLRRQLRLCPAGVRIPLARSLTGQPPSAAGGPGSPGTDERDSRVAAMQG